MITQKPIDYRGKVYVPLSLTSPDDISADPILVTVTPVWNAHAATDTYTWVTPENIQGTGLCVLIGPGSTFDRLVRNELYTVLFKITDNPGPEVPILDAGVFRLA